MHNAQRDETNINKKFVVKTIIRNTNPNTVYLIYKT